MPSTDASMSPAVAPQSSSPVASPAVQGDAAHLHHAEPLREVQRLQEQVRECLEAAAEAGDQAVSSI